MMRRPRALSLAQRLLTTQVLALLAMAATVVLVAAAVGPALFEAHMRRAGHTEPDVLLHAGEAFISAGLIALGAGLALALGGAVALTLVVTRRVGTAVSALVAGAERVSAGDYAVPVTVAPTEREFARVASNFNAMADRIADTERARRRLMTDLAHELRTPIAAIDVLCEGMQDGAVPADAATLATVRAQTARLTRLATDLRDLSAAEEGRLALVREPVPLADVVETAASTAAPLAEAAGVRLTVRRPPAAVLVTVDRGRVGQILDNLLRNAIGHTPAGGSVSLTTNVDAGTLRAEVRDDGAGIDAADLPHVFDRFYRAGARRHDQGSGMGVGLAISRGIAIAHGGTLTAASAGRGTGATFVLTLPAVA